jgi:hypothetical protein
MKVGNLQKLLGNLSQFLLDAEGKKVGEELDKVRGGLEPFKELSLGEFVVFLAKCEELQRTGTLPGGGGRKKAAVDEAKVRTAAQQVQALAERATDPQVQYATIASEVQQLEKRLKLSVPETIQLAREVGIAASLKSKKAALEALQRMIEGRKESFQRVQAIGQPVS